MILQISWEILTVIFGRIAHALESGKLRKTTRANKAIGLVVALKPAQLFVCK